VNEDQHTTGYLPSLLTLRDESGDHEIAEASAWQARRDATRRLLVDLLGGLPDPTGPGAGRKVARAPLIEEAECWRVLYEGEAGEEIPAYLLVPHKCSFPAPAVVAVHGSSPYGKDTIVLSGQRHNYARHLLERGVVVLAPDVLGMGERIAPGRQVGDTTAFYARHPTWSISGKIVFDLRRAVDYLYTLEFVDKRRIGIMGHSLGGHSGILAAALEPRFGACGASCGIRPWVKPALAFQWSRPRPEQWIYIPRLRDYLVTQKPPPVDFHEMMALIAPRPLYNQSADEGIVELEAMMAEIASRVREVYRVLGAERRVRLEFRDGPHDFPEQAKVDMCEWIAAELGAAP
jgi:poly(3-hydroxybutyrate) depolymerase